MRRIRCLSERIQAGSSKVPASTIRTSGTHSRVKPMFVPHVWAELKVQPTTGLVRHVPVSAKRPTRNSYLVFGVALIIHCIRTNVAEYLSNLVIPVCATGNAFGVPTELKANIAGDGSHVARAKDS